MDDRTQVLESDPFKALQLHTIVTVMNQINGHTMSSLCRRTQSIDGALVLAVGVSTRRGDMEGGKRHAPLGLHAGSSLRPALPTQVPPV